jgi:LysM repeat protein
VGSLRLVAGTRWARWLAPAVFLLAVTGVVLVVRSALHSDGSATQPATRHVTTRAKAGTAPLLPPPSARVPAQYYVIQSGDTLEAIAARFATTVDELLARNPGTEPTTLHPGERIRIK